MPKSSLGQRFQYAVHTLAQRQRNMSEGRRRGIAIVLSFLVAFLLWLTFSLQEQYTVVIEMPIEIGRMPDDRALSERPPDAARVALQGIGIELMRLRRQPPSLMLHATSEQIDVFAAASESPRLPTGVTVQSVSPSIIHLRLDPRVTRRVPIELVNEVRPAQDHDFLGPPRLQPDSVSVSGSYQLINRLESFPTTSLVQQNARETVRQRIALSDTLEGLVMTDILSLEVTVPIGQFTEGRREIEVQIDGLPAGTPPVSLLPSRVEAVYRVPLDQYQSALGADGFFAFVPYESLVADTTGSVRPIVQLPSDLIIRDVRLQPRRVRYWLHEE